MSAINQSDEKLIERVRKELRVRRRLGVFFLIVGVLGVAVFAYWDYHEVVQSFRPFDSLPDSATSSQVTMAFAHATYGTYFGMGFATAVGLLLFAQFVVIGLVWLLGRNRKDRLLLRCWDERLATQGRTT